MRLLLHFVAVFSVLLCLWYLAVAWVEFDLAWGVIMADKTEGMRSRVGAVFVSLICLTVSLGATMAFKEIMEDQED